MSSLVSVVKEISDCATIIKLRPGNEEMADGMIGCIKAKIMTLERWDAGACHQLLQHINSKEGLLEKYVKSMSESCDLKLAQSLSSAASNASGRSSAGAPVRDQTIRYLHTYPKASDWSVLEDAKLSKGQDDVGEHV